MWKTLLVMWISRKRSECWSSSAHFYGTDIQSSQYSNGDFKLPKERLAKVTTPTLVIDGGTTPWLSHTADAVADTLPNARRYTIAGQPHNVADEAMAPVLIEYFQS